MVVLVWSIDDVKKCGRARGGKERRGQRKGGRGRTVVRRRRRRQGRRQITQDLFVRMIHYLDLRVILVQR